MKGKIVVILVCMLMFSSFAVAMSPANMSTKSLDAESGEKGYSHNIFCEFFTLTTCVPCKYSHVALKNLDAGGWHPFYYITLVADDNDAAEDRKEELNVVGTPTLVWDGGYKTNFGGGDIEELMADYNTSIISCGNRNVKDIDLSLDVEWLGAVNPDPAHNATGVIIETNFSWTVTAMDIDVSVTSSETSQYNGHLHVYVTEVNSTYWDDKFGDPYTYCFLDYAFNEDVTISGTGTWSDSTEWDGVDHSNGGGEFYDEIAQENCMVIASIFDEDTNDYTDETAGFRAGDGTDPKTFDLYLGNTTPPPLILSNTYSRQYNPDDDFEFNETYYWKIDVWDAQGNPTYGDIWNFTTRENNPPNDPDQESPLNGTLGHPIDINLSWSGDDPDGDDTTYDVYFSDNLWELQKVATNQSETTYDPSPDDNNLDFNKYYYWQIIAWDEYGLETTGDIWSFKTETNEPPNPAKDPYPKDKEPAAPQELTLLWNGTDPNSGDTLTYDVYFDDVFPPKQEEWNISIMEWEVPFVMPLFQTYYWRIDTWDKSGAYAGGYNWEFTTGLNNPPTDPDIDGPKKGVPEEPYTFTFVSTDPEDHDIRYEVDWGDGVVNKTALYDSGAEVSLTHTWDPPEDIPTTIQIKAIAYDEHDAKSGVSIFEFTLPRNRVFNFNLLEWLFERFPNAFPIIRQLLGL